VNKVSHTPFFFCSTILKPE